MVAAPSNTYLIPVGKQDDDRLNALGQIYNAPAFEFVGDLAQEGVVLDVGCGNGSLTRLFSERYPRTTFVGVDVNSKQIEVARGIEGGVESPVSWDVCDVYHLENLKEKYPKLFDVVFCRFILSHLPDVPSALDQMYRMVKPGGSLFILELGEKHYLEHHPQEIKAVKAWEKMVEMQFLLQGSHKDTVERVLEYARNKPETFDIVTKTEDLEVNTLEKKRLFSLGMEAGIAKLQELNKSSLIQAWGYDSPEDWRADMQQFLETNQSVTMKNHQWIQIKTRN